MSRQYGTLYRFWFLAVPVVIVMQADDIEVSAHLNHKEMRKSRRKGRISPRRYASNLPTKNVIQLKIRRVIGIRVMTSFYLP